MDSEIQAVFPDFALWQEGGIEENDSRDPTIVSMWPDNYLSDQIKKNTKGFQGIVRGIYRMMETRHPVSQNYNIMLSFHREHGKEINKRRESGSIPDDMKVFHEQGLTKYVLLSEAIEALCPGKL